MSQAALAQAVRDTLQQALGVKSNTCEVMFDGQPSPSAGQLWISVHPGSWTAAAGDDYDLDETFGAEVTISMKLGTSPQDRWGVAVWLKATSGLEALARKIIAALHMSNDVMQAANAYIQNTEAGYSDLFHHPLEFQSAAPPTLREADWFTAERSQAEGAVAAVGVSQTLSFGGAKRVQSPFNGLA